VGLPLQTVAMGGMFGMFFSETPVRNYQDALQSNTARFSKFFQSMLQQGIYLAPSAFESLFLSTAHSDGDLERTAAAARVAFEAAA
ncbi:MAG: aspartate aminotransferase family protein, partial [SAR324 cluster bacterium]|nr:aspartate aminotransferase family protein [SAR324 cluster bacterium]